MPFLGVSLPDGPEQLNRHLTKDLKQSCNPECPMPTSSTKAVIFITTVYLATYK